MRQLQQRVFLRELDQTACQSESSTYMKLQNPESKKNLITRLRRIEGQVRGVQSMVDNERDCAEILQQLSSIRSAVQSASMDFLQEYATNCLLESNPPQDIVQRERLVKDIISLIGKSA